MEDRAATNKTLTSGHLCTQNPDNSRQEMLCVRCSSH
jgi:hypothetical protein